MQLPENISGPGFIVFNPHEPDSWYFGSHYLGFAQNRGESLTDISSGLGAGSFNIHIDKKDDAVMYVETRYDEVYCSTDRGISLDKFDVYFNFQGLRGMFLNNSGGITSHHVEGNVLQVSKFGDNLEETYNLNLPIAEEISDHVYKITSHPANPDLLFLVYWGGTEEPSQIFLSPDKGITW
jgi:hypothetical protein